MVGGLPRSEVASQEDLFDYKNPALPVDDRVTDLLTRMTFRGSSYRC